jgi:hypothetical protein
MQMMHWYNNPKTRLNEEVPAPCQTPRPYSYSVDTLTPMSSSKSTGAGARRNRTWWRPSSARAWRSTWDTGGGSLQTNPSLSCLATASNLFC